MVFLGYAIFVGFWIIVQASELAGQTIRQLIQRYQSQTENEVAFELIQRYSQSSGAEQGEIIWGLLAPHQQMLSRIVASMNEDPQDELQNLFLKVHGLFVRGKFPHSNWKYWLSRIVKNEMINHKKQQRNFVGLPLELLAETENPDDQEQLFGLLNKGLERLNVNQRKAIELRYGNPTGKLMTYKDMAARMNCSTGQVHGYLDRAKEKLRNHLNDLVES